MTEAVADARARFWGYTPHGSIAKGGQWRVVAAVVIVGAVASHLSVYAATPVTGTRTPANSSTSAADREADNHGPQELWLAVRFDGAANVDTTLLLRLNDGRLLARAEDLLRWRLNLPEAAPYLYQGESFYALDAFPGMKYQVDEATQTLHVTAPPSLFAGTQLSGVSAQFSEPALATTGGFANYDVVASRSQDETQTAGLFELGAFGAWGTGVGNFLARSEDGSSKLVRLDTTWTRDQPERMASLRLGDAISGAGEWGRPVRFGGVQWASNFATQPGFVSFPLPSVSGEAVLPSTVELYVNGALRLGQQVPTGPFTIPELPLVTGQGEARVVVRDLLGREQVIVQPYYASARLLRPGLHQFSYEAGFVRENYGRESNDYGRFAAAGTHRLGISNRLTVEARAELLREQQTAGGGGTLLLPNLGVLSAAFAASRSDRGLGTLFSLGLERQNRAVGFGATAQVASERFVQLGLQPGETAPQVSGRAFASFATGHGSIGLNYVHVDYREREDVRLLGASYSVTLGNLGFLHLSLLRSMGPHATNMVSLSFSKPLGSRTSASVRTTFQGQDHQAVAQVQRNLPVGPGVGYRLLASAGNVSHQEAGLILQNNIGTYTLEAAQDSGATGLRLGASGGVALVGGHVLASRRIDDAFAVVKVPDYPGVRVYADNQVVGRTDRNGLALVPRLRPYQVNPIRIEQADLPLDAQIESLQANAVPRFRSGLLLSFPIRRSHGALVTAVQEDGQVVPAGAVARIASGSESFPVGRGGELYVTGLEAVNRIEIAWGDRRCIFTLNYPEVADPLPHLGAHRCMEASP